MDTTYKGYAADKCEQAHFNRFQDAGEWADKMRQEHPRSLIEITENPRGTIYWCEPAVRDEPVVLVKCYTEPIWSDGEDEDVLAP